MLIYSLINSLIHFCLVFNISNIRKMRTPLIWGLANLLKIHRLARIQKDTSHVFNTDCSKITDTSKRTDYIEIFTIRPRDAAVEGTQKSEDTAVSKMANIIIYQRYRNRNDLNSRSRAKEKRYGVISINDSSTLYQLLGQNHFTC